MSYTHAQLAPLVAEKWIAAQRHPTLPLTIYNYSKRCQYERRWTPETIACRGLVLDDDDRVVIRPFPKFFNKGETDDPIPEGPFSTYEKYDGSLFLAGRYRGELVTATRGSFTSVQADLGRAVLQQIAGREAAIADGFTYAFELIHPENRIVVNYGWRTELVLLTMIETATGQEFGPPYGFPFRWAEPLNPIDVEADLAVPARQENREGFVIRYHRTGQRLKVKFDEYVRLHKIVTGIHARHIWERLSTGQPIDDILDRVPDEFYQWVRETEAGLRAQFDESHNAALTDFAFIAADDGIDRKTFAQEVLTHPELNHRAMFALFDKRPIDAIIWKELRPEATRPFREEEAA